MQGLGQTQLEAARQAHHTLALALSLGLGLAGLGLAYGLHRFGLFRGRNFRKTFRPFFRLGYSGFFQSQAFQVGLVQPGLHLSRQTARFDQFVLDGLVNFLARLQVVLAHVLAWFDRALVDGLVGLLVYLARSLGNLARHLPGQTAQGYLAGLVVLLGLLLLGWWQLAY
ncbi:MAG: hypothetical protein HC913_19055 [Microscillaceae bacterium]|nr:hypothetical protein [Microscillaceae bacterium]